MIEKFLSYLETAYPLSEPRDMMKALQQVFFGAGHAIPDLPSDRTIAEAALCAGEGKTEKLINGFCRYHLGSSDAESERARTVTELFQKGSSVRTEGFKEATLAFLSYPFRNITESEKTAFWTAFTKAGMPILSHSERYRAAYAPHYRVMPETHAKLIEVLSRVYRLKTPVVLAIDGRCAAGKTTAAKILGDILQARIVHCDDFFIPKSQRGIIHEINLDEERFIREIAEPLSAGKGLSYRKYDCQTDTFIACGPHPPAAYTIVEGSYSTAPILGKYYHIGIFMDVDKEEQIARLRKREEDKYPIFRDKWIPLEEEYIRRFKIPENCDLVI